MTNTTIEDYVFVHSLRKLTSNGFGIVIPKYFIDNLGWQYKDSIKITRGQDDNRIILEKVESVGSRY